jgi:hypothetical protein
MAPKGTIAASILAIAVALSATVPPASAAQDPSGKAEKVSQQANATGQEGAHELETEDSVYMGDQISTNRSGRAQIRFVDNTRIVIGPTARLTIDAFVFSGKTAQTVTLSAVRGAFRFITGNSRKQAYLIKTPVMTIGVRGTGLDGFVEPGTGRTTVAIYEGAAELCDRNGQCIQVGETCGVTVATAGGFQDPPPGSRSIYFPIAAAQGSLLPDFRLDSSACGSARSPFSEERDSHTNRNDSGGVRAEPGGGDSSGGSTDGGSTDSGGGQGRT